MWDSPANAPVVELDNTLRFGGENARSNRAGGITIQETCDNE